MKRVTIRRPGGYERLRLEDAPAPVARNGEVVVDVAAAGVNYADCVVRMGLYASAKEFVGWPITPGFDFAGRTADGAEVFGVTRHPTVGPRQLPLRITLLSPAGRPVQTTMDLPGFWASSYADVRKDMRAQYPKHPWPEDPTQADPTLKAKRRR